MNSVHFAEEKINEEQLKNACNHLQEDTVKILSIRNCKLPFSQLKNILKHVEQSQSLLQLILNIGILTDHRRIDLLCKTLKVNKSLTSLCIHGNNIGDNGMEKIAKILLYHPFIVSLDIGDCNLGDASVETICNLLPPHGKKSGLTELTMSSNPKITEQGWIKLSVSMAASSCLQELYLDYNTISDLSASSVLVGLASHRHLQILDLEGTLITDQFAELLLYLIENYPTKLQKVNLEENNINIKHLKSVKSTLLDVETESEMQDESSVESSTKSLESESYDSGKESEEEITRSEVKSVDAKSSSIKSSPKKSKLKKLKKVKSNENLMKSTDSLWDCDELIEITEPPLVTGNNRSLEDFSGVNLGQVVSVTTGRGLLTDNIESDEELTEVRPVSLC